MKKLAILSATLALTAFGANNAFAEAKNGVGLNAGLISSHMTNPVTGSYQGSGLSLGLDYQIAVSGNFSINPFLMSSGETTSGAVTPGTTAGHGILGLQLRYWIGDAFIGGHLASYSEALSLPSGNTTTSTTATGGGGGLVAGWEDPTGGLFVMGQVDSARIQYTGSNTKMSDFRLSIGYRWK